ncbi:hypothetical protein [Vibrio phage VP4B]|uniref:Uncharacterized protein n=1 Tax=Vibrio phage VP4B TaxID=1262540 RepID=V9M0N6_9CAUD|nr:hypothetical protein FDJ61_gp104 [Vibrio phage VP4B]AGB07218.1 hypothetical protein [Vibrio phage VP4B]
MIQRLDPDNLGEIQHQTIALMLYRAGYGQIEAGVPAPGDDIRYDEEGYDYDHPWAIKQRAYEFAFYELEEIFGDFNTYLKFTPKQIDQISRGVREGAKALAMRKEEAAKRVNKPKELVEAERQLSEYANFGLSSGS